MSDKNPEVVGCDASIMKNVWEIRAREYGQKQQYEWERIEKSALKTINKDWADRMNSKHKYPKRLERKVKPVEDENENLFNKKPQHPRPRVALSPNRQGGSQGRSHPTPAAGQKDKKSHERLGRLHLLMSITQNQPSPMVWGKCWKYNKSLPAPTEGTAAPSDWGHCWRLANPQPHAEPGQPMPNGPNMMDHHSLHLCGKSAYRMMEAKDLDLSLPVEEWQMSYKNDNHPKEKKDSSHEGNTFAKSWMFTSLDKEARCSSEWGDSWKATKPSEGQQAPSNGPANGPLGNGPLNDEQHKENPYGECWKFMTNQLHYRSKSSPVKKTYNSKWVDSWRAAKAASTHKKPHAPGQSQDEKHEESHESPLHKVIMFMSREQKYRDLWSSQFRDEHQPSSEWDKSWQVPKNNSKPSEEIERALRAGQPRMDAQHGEEKPQEQKPQEHKQLPEKPRESMAIDPHYEQLRHEVLYRPKRSFTEKMMHRLEHLDRALGDSAWKEASWKTLPAFHTACWGEQQLPELESLEIKARRERLQLQRATAKMSRSFECQTFRERYPEKEWHESWKNASLLGHRQAGHHQGGHHQGDHQEKTSHSHPQQSVTTSNEHGPQWGMSFRFANPMPAGMDKRWVDCSANESHYTVMWSRENCTRSHLYADFNKDSSLFRLWGNSVRFLKGPSNQVDKGKGKSKEFSDPWEIMRMKMKKRKYIYANIDKCKPEGRKWPGCHLLGKTQPRPKRGAEPVKTGKGTETDDAFKEWAESWRFRVQPGGQKKQVSTKAPSGWGEAWKSLLPLYSPEKAK